MLTPKKALEALKTKPEVAYFLHGDEPYKIEEFLLKSLEALGEKIPSENIYASTKLERIDAEKVTPAEIIESLSTFDLFAGSSQKLVWITNAGALKETDVLLAYLQKEKKEESHSFIAWFSATSLDGRKKFHQWFRKNELSLEFKKPKDAELLSWVSYLAKKKGLELEPLLANMLASSCDGSLYHLKGEIEKIALYRDQSPAPVSLEEVKTVLSNHATPEMYELVRSILEKKKAKALLLAGKQITASEDALGLVGFLVWSLKNARPNSSSQLRKWIRPLLDLDSSLKSAPIDGQTLVDRFILEVN